MAHTYTNTDTDTCSSQHEQLTKFIVSADLIVGNCIFGSENEVENSSPQPESLIFN